MTGKAKTIFDLTLMAGEKVLEESKVAKDKIGLVLFGGAGSYRKWLWSPSAYLQFSLGLENAYAYDIFNGCNSLQVCIQVGKQHLQTNPSEKYVLILIADEMSHVGDLQNSEHSPVWAFGDSSSAVLLQSNAESMTIEAQSFMTDGSFYNDIWYDPKASSTYLDQDKNKNAMLVSAYEKNYPLQIQKALKLAGITIGQLKAICMNQGSPLTIDKTEVALGLKSGTIFRSFQQCGHVGSTDVLIALKELLCGAQRNKINSGDYIALASSSVGYSWGCTVIKV